MKDKRQLIYRILIILMPLLIALVAIPMIYGWYVRTIRTGKIDGSTKNVSINYFLDNGRTSATNSLTYTIDNLTFFDIDNTDETSYFDQMMCDLELKLINTSSSDMTYTVTFTSTKRDVLDGESNLISRSYVACYFSKTPTTTISALKTNGTVSGNTITYTDTPSTPTFSVTCQSPEDQLKEANATASDEATLHLYLIGVQEVDTARSTDFLYSIDNNGNRVLTQYNFTITITGVPKSDSSATEVTTTVITTTN